jgi:hypothetical protein
MDGEGRELPWNTAVATTELCEFEFLYSIVVPPEWLLAVNT